MKSLLIFDADGTLFDSHHSIYRVWVTIVEEFGYPNILKDEEHFQDIHKKYHGKWEDYSVDELGFTEKDFTRIVEIWMREVEEVYRNYAVWYDNMVEVLYELEKRGYTIAIATNNSERLFSNFLNDIEKKYPIHDQISHKEVQKPKPHMILDHMKNLGFCENTTFMIGDTKVDLESARNAGVTSIWAKYGSLQESSQLEDLYDHILESPECLLEIFK